MRVKLNIRVVLFWFFKIWLLLTRRAIRILCLAKESHQNVGGGLWVVTERTFPWSIWTYYFTSFSLFMTRKNFESEHSYILYIYTKYELKKLHWLMNNRWMLFHSLKRFINLFLKSYEIWDLWNKKKRKFVIQIKTVYLPCRNNEHKISKYINDFIIIIMSCRQHRYPWPSLATTPYHSSLLAGLQGYIPYPHIAAVCMS